MAGNPWGLPKGTGQHSFNQQIKRGSQWLVLSMENVSHAFSFPGSACHTSTQAITNAEQMQYILGQSSHRGQCDVKIWDGHEAWHPSVLLLADEEGLWLVDKWLFKICRKDTRRTTTNKEKKWEKATTSRKGGFLNFLNIAQALKRE